MSAANRALLITPTRPATAGNGLALRGADLLAALERDHERVDLLVIDLAGSTPAAAARPRPPARGDEVRITRRAPAAHLAELAAFAARLPAAAAERYDTLLVQRSYLLPWIEPLLGAPALGAALRLLDLDDDERTTHARIATRLEARGRAAEAAESRARGERTARVEGRWLPRLDGVAVAVAAHGDRLRAEHPELAVELVPNVAPPAALEAMARAAAPEPRPEATTLLFVGTLAYPPNEDAALHLGEAIWPRLRALAPAARCRLAGAGPTAALCELGRSLGWEIVADPVDLGELYRAADLAVVPLLAGGGTRIKLLEAMAWGLPAVSTTLGAEGLEVEADRHLLLADDAEAFAAACARALADPELRRRLAQAAHALVVARYTPDQSSAALARLRTAAGRARAQRAPVGAAGRAKSGIRKRRR